MKKYIAANWKMNLTPKASVRLATAIAKAMRGKRYRAEVVIFPDALSLAAVKEALGKSGIFLGGQDCSVFPYGAHTGEIAAASLKALGARDVILGHSERREVGETDNLVKAKATEAMRVGLRPIICVGESAADRKDGRAMPFVRAQLRAVLPVKPVRDITIAYEPIWAIGSGRTPSVAEISAMHSMIRQEAARLTGKTIKVIYGGSVDAKSAASFLREPEIDGLLVGGASLRATSFLAICNQA